MEIGPQVLIFVKYLKAWPYGGQIMHLQLQQIEQKVLYRMWANCCLNWQLGWCLWSKTFVLHDLHPLKRIHWRMSKTFMFTSTSNQYSAITYKLPYLLSHLSVAYVIWEAEKKSCPSFYLFDYHSIINCSFVCQALELPRSWFLDFFLDFQVWSLQDNSSKVSGIVWEVSWRCLSKAGLQPGQQGISFVWLI